MDVRPNSTSSQLLVPASDDRGSYGEVLQTEKAEALSRSQRSGGSKKKILLLTAVALVIIIVLAVVLPVILVRNANNNGAGSSTGGQNSNDGEENSTTGRPSPTQAVRLTTGGDGSTVTTENGTTFTYHNSFGGYWVHDPEDPFNDNARPNSWTPPLNDSWKWGVDRIYGVNLGGLFVLEPFISPALFQRYPGTKDEYELSQAMAADEANGGLRQLEDHYANFITEDDIAEIAGAGLNFLRVPIGFWAIETWAGEPYLAQTSWKYFLRILDWARKYGLRVCLDLHAVPGSQNGWNHSGKLGAINFLAGNMGIANAERTLYYLRVFVEFISQPQYKNVVPAIGIVNEARVTNIGSDPVRSFYLRAHDMIREITGRGEGNGPYIVIHDGFQLESWEGFMPGSDRVILDQHPYFSFSGRPPSPMVENGPDGLPGGVWPRLACDSWAGSANESRRNFGLYFAGEFAASPNDCGLFLLGTDGVSGNPQCPEYDDWEHYNTTMKQGIQNFVMASFDALEDWFFWTWKIGPSEAGRVEIPLWSYQLGLRNGWIPRDPRTARGKCESLGADSEPFDGNYQPWQTGTPSSIPAAVSTQYPWPPASITDAVVPVELLPTYTNTAPIITLAPATFTAAPSQITNGVDGWFNDNDREGGIAPIVGCEYPNAYDGVFAVVPTAACTGQ